MWKKPAAIITRRAAEAQQFVTAYASSLPRATTAQKPVVVAAPIVVALTPVVAAPAIVPVAPAVTAQPNLLGRFLRWIDDTYGDGAKCTANDNGALTIRRAA